MIAVMILKVLFIIVILEQARKTASTACENGMNILGKVAGFAGGLAGGVLKLTPIGAVARGLGGKVLGGMLGSRLAQKAAVSQSNPFTKYTGINALGRFVGRTSLRAGKYLKDDATFGTGKSYGTAADQKIKKTPSSNRIRF